MMFDMPGDQVFQAGNKVFVIHQGATNGNPGVY